MTRKPIGISVPYRKTKPEPKWKWLTEDECLAIKHKCINADDGIYSAIRIAERMVKEKNS